MINKLPQRQCYSSAQCRCVCVPYHDGAPNYGSLYPFCNRPSRPVCQSDYFDRVQHLSV